MSVKKNLEEDGVDVFEEWTRAQRVSLPLPPYPEKFRAYGGEIQFRLKPTDHWKNIERLDNDGAYLAMAIARCALWDLDGDQAKAAEWYKWFKKRVEPPMPERAADCFVFPCIDDSDEIKQCVEEESTDPEIPEPAEIRDLAGYERRPMMSPAAMAAKVPENRVKKFADRTNGLIVQALVRAAAEMQDKKKRKTPENKLAWITWAQKHLPKCILEELANGPALDIIKYRAWKGLELFHWRDASQIREHSQNAIAFFFGADGSTDYSMTFYSRSSDEFKETHGSAPSWVKSQNLGVALRAKSRLIDGLDELKRRVLGNGNGNGR